MGTINRVEILGRLGRDPELKYTQSGVPVCRLSIATEETTKNDNGEFDKKVEWHSVSVWQRTAENCVQFLRKGSMVFVEGSLQTRKVTDQNGNDVYRTEIKVRQVHFMDSTGRQSYTGGYEVPADAQPASPLAQSYGQQQYIQQPQQQGYTQLPSQQQTMVQQQQYNPAQQPILGSEQQVAGDQIPF